MANSENLIPHAHKLTVEEAKKGGQKSAEVRKERKAIKQILNEYLDGNIEDNPQFSKLAAKMGISSDKSIKDVFTMVCLLNSVKNGNLGDLEKLVKLLGEENVSEGSNENMTALADILKAPQPNRNIADFEGEGEK